MTPTTEQLKDLLGNVTPGEWGVSREECYRVSSCSFNIATMHFVSLLKRAPEKQVNANATLIALAPTLAAEVVRLRIVADAFKELLATVEGECPSLVDEDGGASQVLLNLLWDARQALDTISEK